MLLRCFLLLLNVFVVTIFILLHQGGIDVGGVVRLHNQVGVLIQDGIKLFVDVSDHLSLFLPFFPKLSHQLTDWEHESPDQWLVPSLEDAVIDLASQFWAVELVGRKRDAELHGGIQGRIWARALWLSLNIVKSRAISRDQGLDVKVNKSFLDRQDTRRLEASESKDQQITFHLFSFDQFVKWKVCCRLAIDEVVLSHREGNEN